MNIPKPREATSVAIRIGAFPFRNSKEKEKKVVSDLVKTLTPSEAKTTEAVLLNKIWPQLEEAK